MEGTAAVRSSIIGFKDPRADLHKKSPKILGVSIVFTLVLFAVGLNVPFPQEKKLEIEKKAPPVIIQLENIPETRHTVTAPAPKLAIPIEVDDEFMPDDVTIESTSMDINEVIEAPPVIEMPEEEPVPEAEEEEIFEFFAVEEQPQRLQEVAPEYPEAARQAGIEGTVFVRALVGKDGTVGEVQVLKGPDQLHEAAIAAARKTKFSPAKQNDMPVSCWVQMRFRFEIE